MELPHIHWIVTLLFTFWTAKPCFVVKNQIVYYENMQHPSRAWSWFHYLSHSANWKLTVGQDYVGPYQGVQRTKNCNYMRMNITQKTVLQK